MTTPTYGPGPRPGTVRSSDGKIEEIPKDWELLPPGDPLWTRRVKAAGPHFVVHEKRGRKIFSKGVWAPKATLARIKVEIDKERDTDAYAKRQVASARRREVQQTQYVEDFQQAVVDFLAFHPNHAVLAQRLARLVTQHATPVGSGTVARTQRIPVERRAEAAVIAWMRHQTTAYDDMKIARVKGERREVRRMLAAQSKKILSHYRKATAVDLACPLWQALRANKTKSSGKAADSGRMH